MSIKSKIKKNRLLILYCTFVFAFVVFVSSILITYLEINLKEQGRSEVRNNYYDVKFINVSLDFDTTSTIKVDNINSKLSLKINDLYKYTKGGLINMELYNIGNLDAEINTITLTNIDSNIDSEKVEISYSLKEGALIRGSEKKILNIYIKYNEINTNVEDFYNCDINITYKEVIK